MATLSDIVALSQNGLTSGSIVAQLVSTDSISDEKAAMIKADRYYHNQNDVQDIDFRQYVSAGTTKVNANRSNQKISHNFLRLLVNQAVNYVAGNSISYDYDDERFMQYLSDYFMFDYDDNNIIWLKEARKKGRAYLHVYYDETGALKYAVIPSEQIIPIYRDEFRKELLQVLRYYQIAAIDDKGKPVLRKKVEWWDDKEVKIFVEDKTGTFNLFQTIPHWISSFDTTPDVIEPHAWGRVPFVQMFNNDEAIDDLQDIKSFIDAYDIIESEFVNQIADIREILIKVLGYSGTSADEILQAFRGTGIVKIDDKTGDIDVLKTDIPVDARQAALKNLKDNIFMIGQGVDTNPEKIGTSISGIALKMLYGALDLKCSASIRKMHKALYEFMWFVCDDYNRKYNASINYRQMAFTFSKNMITNESDIIDSLAKSKGLISDETIISKHPYVDNPKLEEERMREQEAKQLDEFKIQTNPIV